MVNLSSIMHSRQARLAVPDFFHDKDPPIISYTYTKPIGPTIFNFKKVAREHDIYEPLSNQCARKHPLSAIRTCNNGRFKGNKQKTTCNS